MKGYYSVSLVSHYELFSKREPPVAGISAIINNKVCCNYTPYQEALLQKFYKVVLMIHT